MCCLYGDSIFNMCIYVIYKPQKLGVYNRYMIQVQGQRKFAIAKPWAQRVRGLSMANFQWPRTRVIYLLYTLSWPRTYTYRIHGIFGGGFNLAKHICIAKLNVHHLGCRHEFLSMQYSKPPIKMLVNCIFKAIHQIFDSPIIPCIRYTMETSY